VERFLQIPWALIYFSLTTPEHGFDEYAPISSLSLPLISLPCRLSCLDFFLKSDHQAVQSLQVLELRRRRI
jgi:hypothetical protein